jgi:hypothetical protein
MLGELKRAHVEACQRRDALEAKLAFYRKAHTVPPAEFTLRATRARRDVERIEHDIRQFIATSNVNA